MGLRMCREKLKEAELALLMKKVGVWGSSLHTMANKSGTWSPLILEGQGERVRKEEEEEREGREREKRGREGEEREREYIYYYSSHKLVILTYSNTVGELMFGRTEVLLSVYRRCIQNSG